jgi:hypothetical protein
VSVGRTPSSAADPPVGEFSDSSDNNQMIRRLGLCLLLLPFLPLFAQDDLDWLNNYKAALDEARRTHKPIFLEYRCEP